MTTTTGAHDAETSEQAKTPDQAPPEAPEAVEENPDCPICGTIMIWHDLVVQHECLVVEGDLSGDVAQIRYCMNDRCLLGSDARRQHLRQRRRVQHRPVGPDRGDVSAPDATGAP